ncbi:transcriptional regulator [Malassezia vespertilionis]|uniref:transcriptional regulator n=1 Tax=Malassezia vespertilionis TaxID=2020962 RepID=UPI0024B0CD89|nr:transcriptional regulator [Malassezia vespertilionis]WFD07646.1 transcriptional regulator [Malassezia vespertilionis]
MSSGYVLRTGNSDYSRPTSNTAGPSIGFAGSPAGFAATVSNAKNIDLTDFPALGSQVQPHSGTGVGVGGTNLFSSSYANQAGTGMGSAPMGSGMMNMLSHNASFTHDEFPALNHGHAGTEGRVGAVPQNVHPMVGKDATLHEEDLVGQDLPRHSQFANSEVANMPIHQVLASPADRFGLVGLVSLIKTQDSDMSMMTMGSNLQSLGMNLDTASALSSTFVTPWSQDQSLASLQVEPAYHLPSCYNVQPPPPAQTKIASFSDETLLFIFYSTPRDVLQEVAAQELYARNWRYHKALHLWLTKEQNTEPLQKTPTYERGTYIFFDPGTWEKVSKNFVLMYEMLEEKPPTQGVLPVHPGASHPPTPSQHSVAQAKSHSTAIATQPSRGAAQPSADAHSPQTSFA